MTRNHMALSIFLGTIALTGYGKDVDLELKKLRCDLLKKGLELSELSEKITKQKEVLSS